MAGAQLPQSVIEFDQNAELTRSWELELPFSGPYSATAIAVLPGTAVFVAGTFQATTYPDRWDPFVARLDLSTFEVQVRTYSSPFGAVISALAATTDGSVYLSGAEIDGGYQWYYVRRVF
jgi:streptogramin lyase